MYRRRYAPVVLVIALLLSWFLHSVPAVRASTATIDDAPWGLEDVTTAELTPRRLEDALPSKFNGAPLVTLPPTARSEDLLHTFATEEQLFSYQFGDGPGTSLALVVSTIASGVPALEAILTVIEQRSTEPNVEIEHRNTSRGALVPHVLASERGSDGTAYVLIWGAGDGKYLFTVLAYLEADREAFARELVASLRRGATRSGGSRNAPPASQSGAASGPCELVKIYPGNPGYRGYITGVDGIGDHACLSDLETLDGSFSRDREDAHNRAAARHLGIDGDIDEWTWENWMAIEAERGLPPTCYSCAISAAASRPEPVGAAADPNDPRLLLGSSSPDGGDLAVRRLAAEHNLHPRYFEHLFLTDLQLRAFAGLVTPGQHLNAPQLLDFYDQLIEAMTTPGQYHDARSLYRNLIDQGGYFAVPPAAYPDDQEFVFIAGFMSLCPLLAPEACNSLAQRFTDEIVEWRLEILKNPTVSLAEWLQDRGAANWLG